MKICVIHGSPRKGNTYRATEIFKNKLRELGEVGFTEFYISEDAKFCLGCYNCFERGESFCPHAKSIEPIVKAMIESDGIVLTSPVYVLAESAQMKALLDHLAYLFIPHRPNEEMFNKVGFIISTTAGAGTSKAINTIYRSLNYWGLKRVLSCGLTIFTKNWDDMPNKKQIKFEKILTNKARKFYYYVSKRRQLYHRPFTRILFIIMKKMISTYSDDQLDKLYWLDKGWLKNDSPF